jgi:hypothetical protein
MIMHWRKVLAFGGKELKMMIIKSYKKLVGDVVAQATI